MKILFFAAYYHPHVGGYERNIHELAKRLVQKGHEVYVLTCNTESASIGEVKDGVGIWRLPTWNLLGGSFPVPKPSKELVAFLCHMNFDVVVTQTRFFVTSLVGMFYAMIKGIPLVHVERGTCHSVVTNKFVSLIAKTYDHILGRMIVRFAQVNVGISKAACDFVEHLGGREARVIHNGIEPNNLKRQFHSGCTITFVGRLIYAKGVQDLFEAFEMCDRLHDDMRLLIVGDGNYRQQLESQARLLWCGERIQFYGEVDHKSVMGLLLLSDVFVNPSYSEGLPTSVMEAASVGLPIVATDVGGTREIIRNGMSGIIVKPHQPFQIYKAIEYYLSDLEGARAMGISARTLVSKKFNWDKITDEYEKLLKGLANG